MTSRAETPSSGTGHGKDYAKVAHAYAKAAAADQAGKKFCKWVRLAAQRHLDDLKRAAKKGCDFYFDAWEANNACDFIEKLPHVEGSWESATLELEPAQVFILACVFGWRRKLDGRRRFTRVYCEVARKNAKSTLTAGVALYCLCCENELGPQIIIGATTGNQAKKVFEPAKKMVARTAALRDAFALRPWARAVTCDFNGGSIETINSKSSTQDGHNPYVGILDELHAHKDRGLFDVIRSAFGARKQPLMWMITTAGFNMTGVCYEQRTMVTKMLEGVLELDHYFGIVFTIDEGDDPFDPRVWIKANPLLGKAVDLEEFKGYAKEAKASPASLGEFLTKRLNIWLRAATNWLSPAQWKAAEEVHDWSAFDGLDCYVGTDLSDRDDITAVVIAAIDKTGRLIFKSLFFLPESVLDRDDQSDTSQTLYATWSGHNGGPPLEDVETDFRLFAEDGAPLPVPPPAFDHPLVITPGDFVDLEIVEQIIRWMMARFAVRRVTSDHFSSAQGMAVNLNKGLAEPIAVLMQKNAANFSDPSKEIEARLKAGPHQIAPDVNPVMAWMASNAVVTRKIDGSLLPKKDKPNSPNKIDGIDALVNAVAPMLGVKPPPPAASYVETEDIIVL